MGTGNVAVVDLLLQSQQTLVETVELARVTGLLLSDVQYRAQMARVHSLLLRTAGPHGWLLGGADPSGNLTQSPFLLHPKEARTAGLYRAEPVAVLDFASLYPSLFVAYNLCCSSLVHPGDRHRVPEEHLFVSPTGATFTRASLHRGVLPRICAALIAARKDTQRRLSTPPHAPCTGGEGAMAGGGMAATGAEAAMSAEEQAALDGRQRALKLCANALYGFTGSNASPLRTVAVADSCLGLGAAACMHAKDAAPQIFPGACRVIYGQTDSIFVLFPGKTPAEAAAMGAELASRLSELFPAPMAVKLERVLCPFMLLQVNRYAGRQVFPVPSPPPPAQRTAPHQHQGSTPVAAAAQEEEEKDMSLLLVKGIETDRRDVPLFVRTTCRAVIRRILLDGDVAAAAREARAAVVRLMTGGCSMFELIMTGGLWRVNDSDLTTIVQQTAAASAAAAGRASRGLDTPQRSEATAGGGAGREGAGPATAEEGRGPHVALAARLKARDPDRRFLIGERIPYILLDNGARLQDGMAEEPLLALLSQLPPNAAVYARNKLQKPLFSIFQHLLSPEDMASIFVPVPSSRRPAMPPAFSTSSSPSAAPLFTSPHATLASGRAPGQKQSAMTTFYKKQATCLVCQAPLRLNSLQSFCEACLESSRSLSFAITQQRVEASLEAQTQQAMRVCSRCHMGGELASVVCINTECKNLFDRWESYFRLGRAANMVQVAMDTLNL
ncbi:unnamed protein product [Closterium sp. NIES-53]